MSDDLEYEEIFEVSKKVYDIMPYEKYQEMYDSVMAEYNEEESLFPQDAINKLLDKLAELVETDPSVSTINDQFLNVVARADGEIISYICSIIYQSHGKRLEMSITPESDNDDFIIEEEEEEVFEEPHAVITESEMEANQEESINKLAESLHLNNEVLEILFKKFNFRIETLEEKYLNDSVAVLKDIGLTPEQATKPIHLKKFKDKTQNLCCEVCYLEQNDGAELYGLPCGHLFCKECWEAHMTSQISHGSFEIRCQQEDCKNQVTIRDVRKFCGDKIARSYRHFIMKQAVQLNRSYVVCIRPGCPNILTPFSIGLCHVATCSCGFRMCWKCKQEAHAPLDCKLLSKWYDITKTEYLENKWITENTKQCPSCHKRIEKNGGCNHMTCLKDAGGCGYEFCWICGHEWKTHKGDGYSCNKFVDYSNNNFDNKGYVFNMKRLLHYQGHYLNQKKNQEIEKKNQEIIKSRLIRAFENYPNPEKRLSTSDALTFVNEIFQSIETSRSVLIWSYPHAFFMKANSKELELFEYVQKIVESAIEELTYAVENQMYLSPDDFKSLNIKLTANTDSLNKHVDRFSGLDH